MEKNFVLDRLRELGIYSDYYYRLEIKPLAAILNLGEQINCVLTGIYGGRRQMLAVTDSRLIIVGAALGTTTEIVSIKRNSIKNWKFNKKFLLSSVEFSTDKTSFLIKNTQGGRSELFSWAMNQPIGKH